MLPPVRGARPAGTEDGHRPPRPFQREKTFDEWRKLKIENDNAEAAPTETAWICERIRTAVGLWREVCPRKFVNEAPARLALMDVASVRETMRTITDQCGADVHAIGVIFERPEKGDGKEQAA